MEKYAVRRLGTKPCSKTDYTIMKKREAYIKAGDKDGLAKFDEAVKAKKTEKGEQK